MEMSERASKAAKEGHHSKVAESLPTSHVPLAEVSARHQGMSHMRMGRGFSWGEVREAGLDSRLAFRWGLLVDRRRRTVVQTNVAALKAWAGSARPVPVKHEGVEKVEEEVRKVEERVKKEASAAKKEVKKVEKKASKAAKVVEEEAKKPLKSKAKPKASKKKSD